MALEATVIDRSAGSVEQGEERDPLRQRLHDLVIASLYRQENEIAAHESRDFMLHGIPLEQPAADVAIRKHAR